MQKDTAVILAAAGKSSRFGQPFIKKVFATLAGKPVWQHSATLFTGHASVKQVLLVIHPDDREMVRSKYAATIAMMGIEMVLGGEERWQSVENALAKVREDVEYIAVHDAARPLLTIEDFDRVLEAARTHGAAILGDPIHGTVKRAGCDGWIEQTVPRDGLFQAQTPQVFRRDWLVESYAERKEHQPTDDSILVEAIGERVKIVTGSRLNIKITTAEDLRWAELAYKTHTSLR
jgi:2-C-methyl-D-erythritol 4-phosphate cytidylyltransferase